MKQRRIVSLVEIITQRAGGLFVISPAIAIFWLPMNGREVMGYVDAIWLSWPFMAASVVYGYAVRRLFEGMN